MVCHIIKNAHSCSRCWYEFCYTYIEHHTGVAGLTTSLCLLQKGFKVTIFAKHISPNTTSDIAAALWEPYLCEPRERVTGWAFESLKIFKALALNNSEDHGIVLRKAYLLGKHKIEAPFWMNDSVDPVFFSSENDVDGVLKRSGGYYAHGLKYNVPSIDMSIYLEWLLKNILSLGGKIQLKHVKDIKDLMKSKFDVIVNCTGLGSYTLLNDKEMYPIRGQLVLVEAPWIKEFYFDELENAYIIPRKNVVCLGGTADRSWNTKIDHDTTKKIIEKCAKIDPKIATGIIMNIPLTIRCKNCTSTCRTTAWKK